MSGNGLPILFPWLPTALNCIGVLVALVPYVQLDRLPGVSLFEYDIW